MPHPFSIGIWLNIRQCWFFCLPAFYLEVFQTFFTRVATIVSRKGLFRTFRLRLCTFLAFLPLKNRQKCQFGILIIRCLVCFENLYNLKRLKFGRFFPSIRHVYLIFGFASISRVFSQFCMNFWVNSAKQLRHEKIVKYVA